MALFVGVPQRCRSPWGAAAVTPNQLARLEAEQVVHWDCRLEVGIPVQRTAVCGVFTIDYSPKAERQCVHTPLPPCASTPRNGDPEAVSLLLLTTPPHSPPSFCLVGLGGYTGASAIPCAVGGRKISARCNKEHPHIVRKRVF